MGEEKNSRLTEELGRLMKNDIDKNLARFEDSGFEQKLSNRIRDRKRDRRMSLKWALIPASLFLVLGILFINTGKKGIPGHNSLTDQFRTVLESVSPDQSFTATEPFLRHPDSPETEGNTTVEELTGLIGSAIRTVEGASRINVSCCNSLERDHSDRLNHGIRTMSKKNDYSELFSRIIDKLTEG